jgi:hypothetical protein
VTLAFEVAALENDSPIAPTTYTESEPASEDEDLDLYVLYAQSVSTAYNHFGLLSNNQSPYSNFNSPLNAGSEDDGAGDNVYYGTGIFGAGNATDHQYNAALGYQALYSLTDGDNNTALGYKTLYDNTTGMNNTAVGSGALENNTTGDNNTAVGKFALMTNTTGDGSVAVGSRALLANTTGSKNTAIGNSALSSNTTGTNNTASGYDALAANTTGFKHKGV